MKKKSKAQVLAQGLTIHAPNSGAFAAEHGLVDVVSGYHHATVWAEGGRVWLRPENGSIDALLVCHLTRGRVSARSCPLPAGTSRQRVARVALALAGLLAFLNGQENEYDLTILGWVRCEACRRWLTAGASIVNGMGPKCRGAGPTTDRAARQAAGMARMQAIIDRGRV